MKFNSILYLKVSVKHWLLENGWWPKKAWMFYEHHRQNDWTPSTPTMLSVKMSEVPEFWPWWVVFACIIHVKALELISNKIAKFLIVKTVSRSRMARVNTLCTTCGRTGYRRANGCVCGREVFYWCQFCQTLMIFFREMRAHMRTCRACPFCGQFFEDDMALVEHFFPHLFTVSRVEGCQNFGRGVFHWMKGSSETPVVEHPFTFEHTRKKVNRQRNIREIWNRDIDWSYCDLKINVEIP